MEKLSKGKYITIALVAVLALSVLAIFTNVNISNLLVSSQSNKLAAATTFDADGETKTYKVEYVRVPEGTHPEFSVTIKDTTEPDQGPQTKQVTGGATEVTFETVATHQYQMEDLPTVPGYVLKFAEDKIQVIYVGQKTVSETVNIVGGPENTTVKLQLLADGKPVEGKVATASKTQSTVQFEGLPENTVEGTPIVYTWQVVQAPANYEKTAETSPITFNYTAPKTDVKVDVKFQGGEKLVPAEVEVQIVSSDPAEVPAETVTVKKDEGWTATKSLPAENPRTFDPITYTVEAKTEVEAFKSTVEGNVVTYTFENKLIDVPVKLTFEGTKEKPYVEIKVMNGDQVAMKQNINEDTNFNLPKYTEDGEVITYTTQAPELEGYIKKAGDTPNSYIYEAIPRETIEGTINFINGDPNKVAKDVQVTLYADGEEVPGSTKTGLTIGELKNLRWPDLPTKKQTGETIDYTIKSNNVANYTAEDGDEPRTINYTYEIPKIDLQSKVTWVGGPKDIRTNIDVQLLANGEKAEQKTITVSAEDPKDEMELSWENVPQTDINGVDLRYSIVVDPVPTQFRQEFTSNPLEVKLVYVPATGTYTAKVEFDKGPAEKPAVTVELLRNGEVVPESTRENVPADEAANLVYNDVVLTDMEGNAYTYTINVNPVPENWAKSINPEGNIVTLTYVSPKEEPKVHVSFVNGPAQKPGYWVELYNGDELVARGEQKASTQAQHEVTLTPEVPVTTEYGEKIGYRVEAPNLANYKKEIDGMNVVYQYVSPKRDFKAKISLKGGYEVLGNVSVQMYRDGEPIGKVINIAKEDFENYEVKEIDYGKVDETDLKGVPYKYELKVVNASPEFKANFKVNSEVLGYNQNIKLVYQVPLVEYKGEVKYIDGELLTKPEVKLNILRDDQNYGEFIIKDNKYEGTLEKTDFDGKTYEYKFVPELVGEGSENWTATLEKDGNVTVVYKSPKVDLTYDVKWQGATNSTQPLKVALLRDGVKVAEAEVKPNEKTVVFKDMLVTNLQGKNYEYTIELGKVPGFTVEQQDKVISVVALPKGGKLPFAGTQVTSAVVLLAVLLAGAYTFTRYQKLAAVNKAVRRQERRNKRN